MVRVNINRMSGRILRLRLDKREEKGRGSKSAISRSNIKNKIATRKNRKEKGRRLDFIGSKPHS